MTATIHPLTEPVAPEDLCEICGVVLDPDAHDCRCSGCIERGICPTTGEPHRGELLSHWDLDVDDGPSQRLGGWYCAECSERLDAVEDL